MAVVTVFSGILIAQPTVYAAVKSVFYSWGDIFLDYQLESSEGSSSQNDMYYGIKVNWVPENFVMIESKISPRTFSSILFYDTSYIGDGEIPKIDIQVAYANNGGEGGVDNEHGILEPLEVKNAENIQFIHSNVEGYYSFLLFTKGEFFYQLSVPYEISTEEIVKIAESIEILY